jgi:hypothetical protein
MEATMTEFPDIELPTQLGATTDNLCFDFCLRFLGRPWATVQGCGGSPDEAADTVAGFVQNLNEQAQAMGFPRNSISFVGGACPV